MSTTQNAVAAITYADVPGFPTGTSVDHISVSVVGSAPGSLPVTQNVAPGTASVTFNNLAVDTYAYTVQGQAANGDGTFAGIGTAVTGSFSITATTPVTLSLPSAVAVTQP